MKELDQSKRIIPIMMRWPDAWVNIKYWTSGRTERDAHLIDHKMMQSYRKIIEYYNIGVTMQDDGEITITAPEIYNETLMTIHNRWIESNSSYADFLIICLDRDSLELDRAILCYCARPSSKKTLNDDCFVVQGGVKYLNLKFKGMIIESEAVNDLAKDWIISYKRYCDESRNCFTSGKNHSNESVKSHKVKPIKRKKD